MLFANMRMVKNRNPSPTNPFTIAWDVYGYYLYLPATFIYHDLPLRNENKWLEETNSKYYMTPNFYQAHKQENGNQVIIFPMGWAIAYSPAFFCAHVYAKLSGYPADGFSPPYQWALYFMSLLYMIIGVFLLRKILLHFFNDKLSAITLALIVVGTNYFFQAGIDPTMPHNMLFTLNCAIIWFTIKFYEQLKIKHAVTLGLLLGWAILCRPTEILWALLPLLWGVYNKETIKAKIIFIKTNFKLIFILVLTILITGFIQMIYWKYVTGNWFSYNRGEKLSFTDPYTLQFLFSYKKGWLLYTPMIIFAIIGFYNLYKNKRELFFPFLLFCLLNVYILSCWEAWWYGETFSQRPVVEMYGLMALPLGYFVFDLMRKKFLKRIFVFSVLSLVLLLNLFQIWQFCNGIISTERMTKKYYWSVFLKTSVPPEASQYLEVYRPPWDNEHFTDDVSRYYKKEILNFDFENYNLEDKKQNVIDTFGYESKKCFMLDEKMQFSPSFSEKYYSITGKTYLWVKASVKVFPAVGASLNGPSLVITLNSKGTVYKYNATGINKEGVKAGQWNTIEVEYMTPYVRHAYDHLEIYVWNNSNSQIFIDDLKAEVYEPKVEY